jgi:hypothetical protein
MIQAYGRLEGTKMDGTDGMEGIGGKEGMKRIGRVMRNNRLD